MDRKAPHRREDPQQEILARVRRIETRHTQFMIALGVDTQSQKPEFLLGDDGHGQIILPSPHTSMKEVLDKVPPEWEGAVEVFLAGSHLATIRLAPR